MGLVDKMFGFGFMFTGTVHNNRLVRPEMAGHKSNPVTLMSSHVGPDPVDKARRWSKTKKDYTEVDRPFIIKKYNTNIGGVDMLDARLPLQVYNEVKTLVPNTVLSFHHARFDKCLVTWSYWQYCPQAEEFPSIGSPRPD